MKKKVLITVLSIVAAAACALAIVLCCKNCKDKTDEEVYDTFRGVVSEESYATREDALQAFLIAETHRIYSPHYPRYVSDESKGALSSEVLASLNLTAATRDGLVGGEKTVVTYKRGMEDLIPPVDSGGYVAFADVSDNGSTDADDGDDEPEETYTQTAYLLNYGNAYRYYTPLPEVGEALTVSYYNSVVDITQYANYTFSAQAAQSSELDSVPEARALQTVNAKATESGIHVKTNTQETYLSSERQLEYINQYGYQILKLIQDGIMSTEQVAAMLEKDYASGVSVTFSDEEYRRFADDIYYVLKSETKGDFREDDFTDWTAGYLVEHYWVSSEEQIFELANTVYPSYNTLGLRMMPFQVADYSCSDFAKTKNGFTLSQYVIDNAINGGGYDSEIREFDIILKSGKISEVKIDFDLFDYTVMGPNTPLDGTSCRKTTFTFDGTCTDFGNTQYAPDETAQSVLTDFITREKASDPLTYKLNDDEESYSVTGLKRRAFKGAITIPSEYDGKPVTAIADSAFRECFRVTDIDIPDSVTSIGYSAFEGCRALTSITIPDSVATIGSSAFSGTAWYDNQPDGLVYVGKAAYDYKGIMPENTSIIIKDGTKSISNHLFFLCDNLTSITLPDSLQSIGRSAFYDCSRLTSITIPDSVTSIDSDAFAGCECLTVYCEVTAKPSGWSSGWMSSVPIVWDCKNNDKDANGYAYTEADGIRYSLKDGTATVLRQPRSARESITIPSSIKYKGTPYDVTRIDSLAFYRFSELTNVTIPDSVTSIGEWAFRDCNKLVQTEGGVQYVDKWAVFCDDFHVTDVTLRSGTVGIADNVFESHHELISISLPESVKYIGSYSFYVCSVSSITIPSGVTSIGSYAFCGCHKLTSITVPNSVTSIGERAFSNCDSLTNIVLSDNVTDIGDYAFEFCQRLESITIGSGVTHIGFGAFAACYRLMRISFNGTKAQWNAIDKDTDWDWDLNSKYTVQCTDGIIES